MNVHFPDEILDEGFSLLLFYVLAQVAVVAKFKHHIEHIVVINERVKITNDKRIVQFGMLNHFLQCFVLQVLG
jgi:hypothetical protein